MFKITIKQSDHEEKFEGENLLDALANFKPKVIKSGCRVLFEEGKKSTELLYYPRQVRKLAGNKFFQIIQAKRIATRMGIELE